jgi:hypothetical protein
VELSTPGARAARCEALAGLQPGSAYACSPLHAPPSVWVEKNCYVDIWIEVLHALKLDPLPVLPFTLAIDFVGDQWTFFKPPHGELYELYGLDVQELNVWRPLAEHALEHLSAGRLVSTEADAWWLPDTAGTDYHRQHTKSTIVLAEVDLDRQFATYFHNGGFFQVEGQDFRELFRLDLPADAPYALPLFAETIRTDRIVRRPVAEQVMLSLQYLSRHVARRPSTNPVRRFAERWSAELPLLQQRGLAHYHAWAFGTLRQLGAAFELTARNLDWLAGHGEAQLQPAVQAFDTIANGSKTLILKGARSVTSGKPLDVNAMLGEMAAAWDRGMDVVASRCAA